MANFHVIAGASETPEFLIVRKIGPADLKDVLRKGFADFWAMPSQVFFIGLIYPIAGVILAGFAFGQNMLPLLYPLASGFALVGPLVSIGLYELSRRREQGLPTDWKYAFFMAWLFTAQAPPLRGANAISIDRGVCRRTSARSRSAPRRCRGLVWRGS